MNRKLLTLLLALALLVPAALAANPGHDATRIAPGSFEGGGTYIFPSDLQANSDFIVDTNTLFVNSTSGNIGIGTLNPTSKLYVEGSITVNSTSDVCIDGGNCLSSVTGGISSAGGWTNTSTTTYTDLNVNVTGNITLGGTYFIQAQQATGTNTVADDITIAGGRSTGNASPGSILFQTSAPGGNGSSVQPLTTRGGFNGTDFFVNTDTLFVDASTNSVGIGTDTPATQLDVIGSIQASTDICIDAGNCLSDVGNLSSDATGWSNTSTTTSTSLDVSVGGAATITGNLIIDSADDTLYVDSTANEVGIGTNTPGAALEVDGGVRLNPSTSRPTCDSGQRGTMWYEDSSSGTDDYLWSCMRNSTDNYNWILVARGG